MGAREGAKTMAIMRQSAPNGREMAGTRTRDDNASVRSMGGQAMFSRLTGAIFRALLMAALIATPYLLLPANETDASQIVAFLALVAAAFTLVEYNAAAPSLVEFRDARPFNRLRFLALFGIVFAFSTIQRGEIEATTLTRVMDALGARLGGLIDFPYSPVRLVVLMMPENASQALVAEVRTAAGVSYVMSLLMLAVFWLTLRLGGWPAREGGFNIWVNMPTFDPMAGGDIVERLQRDAQFNLILGFLLPFIIPAVVKLASDTFDPVSLADPHTLIWTMSAWAFLPASLLMRGLALHRVARMIAAQRARAMGAEKGLQPA